MSHQISHPNCVVLRQSAGELCAELRNALDSRQYKTEILCNPYSAFARLCLIERLESVRSGWGLERGSPLSLVIDGDFAPHVMTALFHARDRYLPGVGIHHWNNGVLVELRPAAIRPPAPATQEGDRNDVPNARSAPSAPPREHGSSGPVLHLVEPPDVDARMRHQPSANHPSIENGEDPNDRAADSLSTDEVRMLLGNKQDGPDT